MADSNNYSLYQEQKKLRPKLEDVLSEYLSGDIRKTALNFAAWLKTIKMTPQWGSGNSWKLSYKSKAIGYIKLNDGSWYVCPAGNHHWGYDDFIGNEVFKELILRSVKPCTNCGPCAPGKSLAVCGEELDCTCGWFTIRFCDPGPDDLEKIKQLIDIRKKYYTDKLV